MEIEEALAWLEKKGNRRIAIGLARFGIETKLRVLGVPMGTLLSFQKQFGRDHALAGKLWTSGCYDARLLATLVAEPKRVTRRQMETWAASFENWADCDTACFKLFDQTPFAWEKARAWATSPRELVKRAGFALMACLALHDKTAPDAEFLALLPLIERAATDERNFVKKAVSWALRAIGRRNLALNAESIALAERLAQSDDATCRWVGKDALRDFQKPAVRALLARRAESANAKPKRTAKKKVQK